MKIAPSILIGGLVFLTVAAVAPHSSKGTGSPDRALHRPAVEVGMTDSVKVVYHIKVGATSPDELAAGIAELRHLLRLYDEEGILRDQRDIHAVFDADGVPLVLKDDSYQRLVGGNVNPNASVIAELVQEGVALEVCGQRMARDKLTGASLLPGATRVHSGQTRVIELQLLGYAYFRF